MRSQNNCAIALAEARQQLDHLSCALDIHIGEGLIEQQQIGLRHKHASERGPLTHALRVVAERPIQLRIESDLAQSISRREAFATLTTHYMDEAERLCDRVAVVDHGKIIAQGSPAELVAELHAPHIVEFASEPALAEADLKSLPGVRDCRRRDDRWFVSVASPRRPPCRPCCRASIGAARELVSLSTHRATLEDVFISLTGRELRDEVSGVRRSTR